MHRDLRVLLMDIEQAGADIKRFTEGATFGGYLEDTMMQAAVERKFEIIGMRNHLRRATPTSPQEDDSTPVHQSAGAVSANG